MESRSRCGRDTGDINHVNGDIYETEAEFFEREGDDWVFYADRTEVFRVSWFDVQGEFAVKAIRPRRRAHAPNGAAGLRSRRAV